MKILHGDFCLCIKEFWGKMPLKTTGLMGIIRIMCIYFFGYIFRYIFLQNPGYNHARESDNLDALQCKNGIAIKRTYCDGWSSGRDYTPLCDLRYRH